jgi:hypothetical protein
MFKVHGDLDILRVKIPHNQVKIHIQGGYSVNHVIFKTVQGDLDILRVIISHNQVKIHIHGDHYVNPAIFKTSYFFFPFFFIAENMQNKKMAKPALMVFVSIP